MKVLILAGGYGTRISEETDVKPKPMVDIGSMPVLWHIMKCYSYYGFNEFIILLGYKGYIIKEYFSNYFLHKNNVTINLENNSMSFHKNDSEPWKIDLIDTGESTMTGGRIKRVKDFIDGDNFLLTYGDGLSNVNINSLIKFHLDKKKICTMTAVQPAGRYGAVDIDNDEVRGFEEKPEQHGSWINGGFFVCKKKIIDFIDDDETVFEREPLETLAKMNEISAFKHKGFWGCMDTLRDKNNLNDLWAQGEAPWKIW